ncbi:M48 family metalloprotease [Allosphingosinicella deserti]|uniref:Peptidase M48 Ste24p n=1 Tax=Allosphingosinicella deserti TaxID=2116704 RepID=A0A2P7QN21_9SPHN|nr:M48 family metalloprotease [Sphingomonas deserti]PSJ39358.1 peptidase M48 Ste24p [Sphingomonas deserti]
MRSTIGLFTLASLLLAGCGGPDASGPAVTGEDRAAAAEQHAQLLAEFGGAYQGDESVYLTRLGGKIAAAAGLEGQCTFTLVNTDVVNAFAVPGCYIYVTRGLMAIVGSEGELASVLAHEVGHIVGQHSKRQQKRSLWRGLGVLAVQVLTGSERLTRIAGNAATFFTLRYSRAQEYQADDLGLGFLRSAGYDPYAASDMLGALSRQEQFLAATKGRDEAKSIPEWARTHPLTGSRVERARQAAAATGAQPDALPEYEDRYLQALDGLLYGDDPQQGFVLGRRFAHPVMRIGFEAPAGFTLTNSPQAILIEGPDGLRGEFGGGRVPEGGLQAYAEALLRQLLGDAPVRVGDGRAARVNGVDALFVPAAVSTENGEIPLSIAVYQASGGNAYHFAMVSNSAGGSADALDPLFRSFHLLSAEEARRLRPRRIRVAEVGPGDTIASLAGRMADTNQRALFLFLNDRAPDQPVRPGEKVKIVSFAER